MPKVTVFEYSTLAVDEQGFTEEHLSALARYNDLNKNKYFTVGYRKVTFKSYVGVLQVGNFVIEVLPKADQLPEQSEETVYKWQRALLFMLRSAGYIKMDRVANSAQKLNAQSLLDIYLYAFLQEVDGLIHHGLVKKYRKVQANQTALKGQLLMGRHIQENLVHKERFFVEHTVYDRNHLFNGILKKALTIIQHAVSDGLLKGLATRQLLAFEGIDTLLPTAADFKRVQLDRKTQAYEQALSLAKLIILHYSPDLQAGREDVLAILFNMNKLFEKFVFRELKKKEFAYSDYALKLNDQSGRTFWKEKTIRPDIIADFTKDGKKCRVIIDTKWKMNWDRTPSDGDLKQMFTYNIHYRARHSILLYPQIGLEGLEKENYEPSDMIPGEKHSCQVYFAQLFHSDGAFNEAFTDSFLKAIIEGYENES